MENNSETKFKIHQIAESMRDKGKPIPEEIQDIPDFPFQSFDTLRDALRRGSVLIQRFSVDYDSTIFNLFATPYQRHLSTFYQAAGMLLPLVAIVLAFIYSWWWLAGVPSLFLALSRSKIIYNHVILSAAISSELYFSFLYYTGQVCVTTSDFSKSYYWHRE